jgi:hypothetical protein
MVRRFLIVLAVAVAAVTAAVAVTAAGRTGHEAPSLPAGSAVGAQIRLPLDAYQLTPAETARVDRARRAALAACLRRFGFGTPPAAEPQRPDSLNARRYGVTDPQVAAHHGYHSPYGARRPGASTPRSGAERTALTGDGSPHVNGMAVPPGGGLGTVDRELHLAAPTVPDAHLAYRLGAESYRRSRTDPRVTAAFARWSACLRRAGYSYPDPTAVMADPRFQTRTATPAEIAVARADVACKAGTGLVPLWTAVETAHQLPLIAAHRPALETIGELNRARVAGADRIVTSLPAAS